SAKANVRPNGPSNGAVTIGTSCWARSSCSWSTFSALSHRATPQPSRLVASRSTAGSRTANGIGSVAHTPPPRRRDRCAVQPQPFGVETCGRFQVPHLEGDEVGSGDRHAGSSLFSYYYQVGLHYIRQTDINEKGCGDQ